MWLAHRQGWLPPGDDPLARLDLDAAPGLFTGWQLRALRDDPAACRATLKAAGIEAAPVPNRPLAGGCGLVDAVRYGGEKARFRQPVAMTCALAAAFVLFERHALIPAADRELTSRITRIEDLGTYNCRNIGHDPGGRRSEHATANAIDLAGFVTAGGQRIGVKDDWGRKTPEGRFLARVRDGACRFFAVVLGPDYNAAHADHLHLDMGPFSACE
ncbi:extensin family protein [Zavarzinia compransoris]|uniref:extensin-like domain-containing protein n=1 Tax=Zavarzinia compransoris TaxID=1264899 RepID=UPI0010E0161A|nr:extensin family protein [Zavarzinia compransoris]TDP47138.1 extensin-like protein [Zavarzinia compransoris]